MLAAIMDRVVSACTSAGGGREPADRHHGPSGKSLSDSTIVLPGAAMLLVHRCQFMIKLLDVGLVSLTWTYIRSASSVCSGFVPAALWPPSHVSVRPHSVCSGFVPAALWSPSHVSVRPHSVCSGFVPASLRSRVDLLAAGRGGADGLRQRWRRSRAALAVSILRPRRHDDCGAARAVARQRRRCVRAMTTIRRYGFLLSWVC